MNRVWPGDPAGTLHERMAARLWEVASDADAVVDLHTGSPDMLTHVVYKDGDEGSRELAEAFGTECLLAEPAGDDASEEWQRRNFAGKFRVAAAEEGIPSITPELAHNKQIIEEAVETGVTGVLNVLRYLGVLEGTPERGDPAVARNHLGRVDAAESGLFRPHPDRYLGERLVAGTPLGTVYDPTSYDVLQEPTVDREGILYSLTREATVVGGDKLANVAIPRE
jgi:predicted deacylase